MEFMVILSHLEEISNVALRLSLIVLHGWLPSHFLNRHYFCRQAGKLSLEKT